MTTVTSQEIAQFRSQLSDDIKAMKALDVIEECEGDLEDAAMTLAIRAGQQPEIDNSEWLDASAKKWRAVICQSDFREELTNGSVKKIMQHIQTIPNFPQVVAVPVLMYVIGQDVNKFCEPLDTVT